MNEEPIFYFSHCVLHGLTTKSNSIHKHLMASPYIKETKVARENAQSVGREIAFSPLTYFP